MADASSIATVRVTPSRSLAREWALALAAEGLSSRLTSGAGGFAVEVAEERLAQAAAVLDAYELENAERGAVLAKEASGSFFNGTADRDWNLTAALGAQKSDETRDS